jgi:hypothetical protein
MEVGTVLRGETHPDNGRVGFMANPGAFELLKL